LLKGGLTAKAMELNVELKKWNEAKDLMKKSEKLAKTAADGGKMGNVGFSQDIYKGQVR
jgi:hypothetical protein